MEVKLIGVDVAKRVFELCGVDGCGETVLRKAAWPGGVFAILCQMRADDGCDGSVRDIVSLGARTDGAGHGVRLLPPRYVKSYVWRNKTDAADAAAICAASRDPRIHDVPVKSVDQQGVLALHRVRELLVRQRTTLGNALRAHLAEFGVVAPQGQAGLTRLRRLIEGGDAPGVPAEALAALAALTRQWAGLDARIRDLERAIERRHRSDEVSRRLARAPGIGPLTATALAATVGDARNFPTGPHLAAWLGLTPRKHASASTRSFASPSGESEGE